MLSLGMYMCMVPWMVKCVTAVKKRKIFGLFKYGLYILYLAPPLYACLFQEQHDMCAE